MQTPSLAYNSTSVNLHQVNALLSKNKMPITADVYQHGVTTKTGNYCLGARLYMWSYAPRTHSSEASFQEVVSSGYRL